MTRLSEIFLVKKWCPGPALLTSSALIFDSKLSPLLLLGPHALCCWGNRFWSQHLCLWVLLAKQVLCTPVQL